MWFELLSNFQLQKMSAYLVNSLILIGSLKCNQTIIKPLITKLVIDQPHKFTFYKSAVKPVPENTQSNNHSVSLPERCLYFSFTSLIIYKYKLTQCEEKYVCYTNIR